MKKYILILGALLLISCTNSSENEHDFTTIFETSNGTETSEYAAVISFYKNLSEVYKTISIFEIGETDSGNPLHLITFSATSSLNSKLEEIVSKEKNTILINNGIHPGESDGIDASMMLLRDLAQGKINSPKNTVIAVIAVYNVGGALNRNSTTRTNQNGPKEYGFRGNARNFDLNRDFIKNDTKNAKAFAKAFHLIKPTIFIDNHVSNGADYQYTLTHLFTQHNKLGGELGDYLHKTLQPELEKSLANKNLDITPYVNVFNRTPESGFSQFMDSPRYSTGYTTLFNTLGMMVETHMLKPYKQRVEGTYELLKSMIEITDANFDTLKTLKENTLKQYKIGELYPVSWKIDSSQTTTLAFKGYEGKMIPSNITNANRLFFDRTKPFTKDITYYNYFKPKTAVTIPEKYIIPQGWWTLIDLLKQNNIELTEITKDTLISVEVYSIKNYETVRSPFEGHYLHYNTEVETVSEMVSVKKGDFIIDTQQEGIRYLLETLEPTAPDSFFNWNFFDTILQQKEGFSPYVWEDIAEQFLNDNPTIKTEFETKKEEDPSFAKNWYMQLDWIHKQSLYYETSHLRYPIFRVGG